MSDKITGCNSCPFKYSSDNTGLESCVHPVENSNYQDEIQIKTPYDCPLLNESSTEFEGEDFQVDIT